jgi:hypothetical protein
MKTILLFLICLVAWVSVYLGPLLISDPSGTTLNLPVGILRTTPFKTFLIPGILLTIMVGVPSLLTVIHYIQNDPRKYEWSLITGLAMSLWIAVQIVLTQTIHWQDVALLTSGLLIILLSYQLKGKWII